MAEQDTEKKEKKSSKKLIMIIVLLLVFGGGGGFGYLKFFKGKKKKNITQASQQKEAGAAVTPSRKLIPMPLNPFLVNLIDPDTRRYLKLRVVLNLSNKKVEKEITNKLPRINDAIIMFLTSKTYDEVISPMGKKKLKKQILKIINSNLTAGTVTQVFFTDFLVQ